MDFGTSNTVAVLRWPDGRAQPLIFDGSPMLPSAVFLGADGQAVTGRHAQRYAGSDPARYEPHPKRCIDDGDVLLGDTAVPVVGLIAAVLSRVAAEAVRVGGAPSTRTVLTHPVGWGHRRREVLLAAAGRAGLNNVELLAEPLAAAAYFTRVLDRPVPVGSAIVVYDFGGGTFDVSVVQRRSDEDWQVLAGDGLNDVGGIDLDHVIVTRVADACADTDPAGWRRLVEPVTPAERRYRRMLLDDARDAKEQLSMGSTAPIHVPLLNAETFVTREEFEQRARPLIERTISLTATTLAAAAVPADLIAGVFLVGGASRIPLVATLLHRRLAVAPTIIEQPELVVAQGALDATGLAIGPPADPTADLVVGGTTDPAADLPAAGPTTRPPADPPPHPPRIGPSFPAAGTRTAPPPHYRTGRSVPLVVGAVVVVVIVLIIWGLVDLGDQGTGSRTGDTPAAATSSACTQPDEFFTPVSNKDLFCTPALKQFAQPWLGTSDCSGNGGVAGATEAVTCEKRDWTVTFIMCASGRNDCPEGRQNAQAGAKVSAVTPYQAQGISGTRITGSRDGVPFVYWDSDSSPATGLLVSKTFNGTPYVNGDSLETIWQQNTS